MNSMTLPELDAALQARLALKKDFTATANSMAVAAHGSSREDYMLEVDGIGDFQMNPIFHSQMATRMKVPLQFYDRALSHPDEFVPLLNALLHRDYGKESMIRTVGKTARAMLSPKYRRIDDELIAKTAIAALSSLGEFQVKSCNLTDRKMYIKVLFEETRMDVKVGDTVEAGLIISNSEVGMGSFSVSPFIHRLWCLNGMVVNDSKLRRRHLGRYIGTGEDGAQEIEFSDETIKAEDDALMLKVRDMVVDTADKGKFEATVHKLQEAAEDKPKTDPEKAVKELSQRFGLKDEERASIFDSLINGGDTSRYGFLNAVTHAAQGVDSYDRGVEMEEIGGMILDLEPSEWSSIAA